MATLETTPDQQARTPAQAKRNGLLAQALRRIRRQRNAVIGFGMLAIVLFVAVFAPLLAPHDPIQDFLGQEGVTKRMDPCIAPLGCDGGDPRFPLGLDGNGRDMLSRIIFGSRISLAIGFFTIAVAVIVGSTLGAISGYVGGILDQVIMRTMDIILSFPSLLLAIAIVAVLGPGLRNAMLAIAVVNIPIYARLVRASVLSAREEEYVEASRALGAGTFHILFKRIMPNVLTPLIVQSTLGIAIAIIDIAALSFLGLGAQEPQPEWGSMLSRERNQLFSAPHLVIFPGIAITFTVLAFNLLGDGMRDALDPRLSRSE